jgi:predicted ester cyclase
VYDEGWLVAILFLIDVHIKEIMMDAEKLFRDVLAAIESGDMAKAGNYLTGDFTFSGPVPQPIGKAEYLGLQGALIKAIPNWKFNAKNIKVQGNTVTATLQITGTHTQTLAAIMPGMSPVPATGKKITLPQEPLTVTMRGDKMASLEAGHVPGGGVPGLLAQIGVQLPH